MVTTSGVEVVSPLRSLFKVQDAGDRGDGFNVRNNLSGTQSRDSDLREQDAGDEECNMEEYHDDNDKR